MMLTPLRRNLDHSLDFTYSRSPSPKRKMEPRVAIVEDKSPHRFQVVPLKDAPSHCHNSPPHSPSSPVFSSSFHKFAQTIFSSFDTDRRSRIKNHSPSSPESRFAAEKFPQLSSLARSHTRSNSESSVDAEDRNSREPSTRTITPPPRSRRSFRASESIMSPIPACMSRIRQSSFLDDSPPLAIDGGDTLPQDIIPFYLDRSDNKEGPCDSVDVCFSSPEAMTVTRSTSQRLRDPYHDRQPRVASELPYARTYQTLSFDPQSHARSNSFSPAITTSPISMARPMTSDDQSTLYAPILDESVIFKHSRSEHAPNEPYVLPDNRMDDLPEEPKTPTQASIDGLRQLDDGELTPTLSPSPALPCTPSNFFSHSHSRRSTTRSRDTFKRLALYIDKPHLMDELMHTPPLDRKRPLDAKDSLFTFGSSHSSRYHLESRISPPAGKSSDGDSHYGKPVQTDFPATCCAPTEVPMAEDGALSYPDIIEELVELIDEAIESWRDLMTDLKTDDG